VRVEEGDHHMASVRRLWFRERVGVERREGVERVSGEVSESGLLAAGRESAPSSETRTARSRGPWTMVTVMGWCLASSGP